MGMNLSGPDSMAVNGQLVQFPTSDSWTPRGYGQQTVGVPNVSPSIPPFMGAASGVSGGAAESVGGYGTAGANQLATIQAANHPWSLKASPVLWAVGGLLISLCLLKSVHWRDTMLEGDESARIGGISEEARAAA
jgi:hypothetical protein